MRVYPLNDGTVSQKKFALFIFVIARSNADGF